MQRDQAVDFDATPCKKQIFCALAEADFDALKTPTLVLLVFCLQLQLLSRVINRVDGRCHWKIETECNIFSSPNNVYLSYLFNFKCYSPQIEYKRELRCAVEFFHFNLNNHCPFFKRISKRWTGITLLRSAKLLMMSPEQHFLI